MQQQTTNTRDALHADSCLRFKTDKASSAETRPWVSYKKLLCARPYLLAPNKIRMPAEKAASSSANNASESSSVRHLTETRASTMEDDPPPAYGDVLGQIHEDDGSGTRATIAGPPEDVLSKTEC